MTTILTKAARALRNWRQALRDNPSLRRENFLMRDRMRHIEWRLAMCRSSAADVHAAHAIAFMALDELGVDPAMSSASRYQIAQSPMRPNNPTIPTPKESG